MAGIEAGTSAAAGRAARAAQHGGTPAGTRSCRERAHALKGDCRVSVVLPAKNESATVGQLVTTIREELVEALPLVDELIVIDSDSTDDTARVAREAGAAVYAAAGIDTGFPPVPGKGEAIWRSLFVVTGDIIVILDADLTQWSADFIPALLLPFFENPSVALSKGYYRRPDAGAVGGGRVTELVARPMIALHRPALAGIIQPNGGEWAVRRDVIRSMPLPSGYAIDLAVLMNVHDCRGPNAIAQVDLGLRDHAVQDLRALGVMATQLLAYVERRSGLRGPGEALVPLRQFARDTHEPADVMVPVVLRPPVASVIAGELAATRPQVLSAGGPDPVRA